jgi:hypothetical protein
MIYTSFLTEWAVEARYPGYWEEPGQKDARRAVQQADAALIALHDDFTLRGIALEDF